MRKQTFIICLSAPARITPASALKLKQRSRAGVPSKSKQSRRCLMPGNSACSIVLTDRDRLLLKELAIGEVIDREQAKRIAGFKSTTRANDRLLKLVRAGFLRRFFLGTRAGGTKAIYSLSAKGAQVVHIEGRLIKRKNNSLLVGDLFVEHQL